MPYDKIHTLTAFARRLRHDMTTGQSKFAFFLGAGCSISSGIPAATGLVQDRWLPLLVELETGKKTGITAWAKDHIKGYDPDSPGASYSDVMEELFDTPQKRQAEIESITTAGRPNYGYCALARLLSHETYGPRCNVVLTTNFDDLVADALYLYGREGARPLVIGHKSLMNFVSVTRTAPMVVKLHHDRHLAPKNTKDEIGALSPEAKTALHNVLRERGLIFMGYGGADPSVISALEALPDDSLHGGVIWVNEAWPNGKLGDWLAARKAVWVKHRDFDEIMFMIARAFNVAPPPKVDDIQALFERNEDKYKELLKNLSGDPEQEEEVRQAAQEAASNVSNAFAMLLAAYMLEKADPDAADKAYLNGITQHPTNPSLLGYYGRFLSIARKDYDEAEAFYKRAIGADPKHANNLGNYAVFLDTIRKDHEGAETFFKRAIDADPKHANNLGNYASFLHTIRKDYDRAEEYYQRALDADPKHANNLGNYAVFLKNIRKDYDRAEEYYQRAIDADPKHAGILGNYAWFLHSIRKDCDRAEAFYKRAIDADPKHAHALGNYAGILFGLGRDGEGLGMLERCEAENPEPDLLLECNFYRLCRAATTDAERAELLRLSKQAIEEGLRSAGFDFSANVERARIDNVPGVDLLAVLAKVIANEEPAQALDQFPEWVAAG